MAKALRPEQLWLRSVLYGKRSKPIPLWAPDGKRCAYALLDFVGEATRACTFLRRKASKRLPRYVDDVVDHAMGWRTRRELLDQFAGCVNNAEALRAVCLMKPPRPGAVYNALNEFDFVEVARDWIDRYPGIATFFEYATGGSMKPFAQRRIP